jgi:hypothetical protein
VEAAVSPTVTSRRGRTDGIGSSTVKALHEGLADLDEDLLVLVYRIEAVWQERIEVFRRPIHPALADAAGSRWRAMVMLASRTGTEQ